jgi:hypothetical protein
MTDERARLMAMGNELLARAQEHYEANHVGAVIRVWEKVDEINTRYRALLPEVPVARCPDTGTVVTWPIDTGGLDGWFWSYFKTISRPPQPPPPTWLAMTGAMRLTPPLENTPEVVVPGPGTPFVLPRLLTEPGIRAVIAEVPVGAHIGWTITYFGPLPKGVPLIDLWGTDTYPMYRPSGPVGWSAYRLRTAEFDFDLTPWLRAGSLLWLEPGTTTLREGPDSCPFVDLPGPKKIAVLHHGEITYTDVAPVG